MSVTRPSLTIGIATEGLSPYKGCLTHGFFVDEHGRKTFSSRLVTLQSTNEPAPAKAPRKRATKKTKEAKEAKIPDPLSAEELEQLEQMRPALLPIIQGVLAAHPSQVESYRNGKHLNYERRSHPPQRAM